RICEAGFKFLFPVCGDVSSACPTTARRSSNKQLFARTRSQFSSSTPAKSIPFLRVDLLFWSCYTARNPTWNCMETFGSVQGPMKCSPQLMTRVAFSSALAHKMCHGLLVRARNSTLSSHAQFLHYQAT